MLAMWERKRAADSKKKHHLKHVVWQEMKILWINKNAESGMWITLTRHKITTVEEDYTHDQKRMSIVNSEEQRARPHSE
jgi:hypothetical protein